VEVRYESGTGNALVEAILFSDFSFLRVGRLGTPENRSHEGRRKIADNIMSHFKMHKVLVRY